MLRSLALALVKKLFHFVLCFTLRDLVFFSPHVFTQVLTLGN